MSLNPAQCRAARGWLAWTQDELAKKAGVGLSTVRDFEGERRTPIQNNLAGIRRALEEGGAEPFLKATDGLAAAAAHGLQIPEAGQGKRRGAGGGAPRAKRSRRSGRS